MLKKLLIATIAIITSFAVSASQAIDRTNPYQMMKLVSDQAFSRLKAEQEQVTANPNHLKVIVEEELLDYVNVKYAALKLLGTHVKKSKREDVLTFIDAFEGYLVTSYAQALTQYTDQELKFGPEPDIAGGKRIASVGVSILNAPRPDIKLEFKLLKSKKSGEWQAFDMIAEGVSLLDSKQSEWSGKLRTEGVLAVAKELERLAAEPIRLERAN